MPVRVVVVPTEGSLDSLECMARYAGTFEVLGFVQGSHLMDELHPQGSSFLARLLGRLPRVMDELTERHAAGTDERTSQLQATLERALFLLAAPGIDVSPEVRNSLVPVVVLAQEAFHILAIGYDRAGAPATVRQVLGNEKIITGPPNGGSSRDLMLLFDVLGEQPSDENVCFAEDISCVLSPLANRAAGEARVSGTGKGCKRCEGFKEKGYVGFLTGTVPYPEIRAELDTTSQQMHLIQMEAELLDALVHGRGSTLVDVRIAPEQYDYQLNMRPVVTVADPTLLVVSRRMNERDLARVLEAVEYWRRHPGSLGNRTCVGSPFVVPRADGGFSGGYFAPPTGALVLGQPLEAGRGPSVGMGAPGGRTGESAGGGLRQPGGDEGGGGGGVAGQGGLSPSGGDKGAAVPRAAVAFGGFERQQTIPITLHEADLKILEPLPASLDRVEQLRREMGVDAPRELVGLLVRQWRWALWRERFKHFILFFLVAALALVFLIALPRTMLGKHPLGRVLAAVDFMVLLWLTAAFVMWLTERPNPSFDSLWDSFWGIAVYLFSGIEDKEPLSATGRVIAGVVLGMGIVVGTYVTGEAASAFTNRALNLDRIPPWRTVRDHLVVCLDSVDNLWLVDALLRDLRSRRPRGWRRVWRLARGTWRRFRVEIVVVMRDPPDQFTWEIRHMRHRGARFLRGDSTRMETLRAARAYHARAVLVVESGGEVGSRRAVQTVAALWSAWEEHHAPAEASGVRRLGRWCAQWGRRFVAWSRSRGNPPARPHVVIFDEETSLPEVFEEMDAPRSKRCERTGDRRAGVCGIEAIAPVRLGPGLLAQAVADFGAPAVVRQLAGRDPAPGEHAETARGWLRLAVPQRRLHTESAVAPLVVPDPVWRRYVENAPFEAIARSAATGDLKVPGVRNFVVVGVRRGDGPFEVNPVSMGTPNGRVVGPTSENGAVPASGADQSDSITGLLLLV